MSLEITCYMNTINQMLLLDPINQMLQLIGMEVATPAELARTEDPGLSIAREAAEVLPAESVHSNGNHYLQFLHRPSFTNFQNHYLLGHFCQFRSDASSILVVTCT